MNQKKPSRRKARVLAMQALYQWAFTQHIEDELINQFLVEHNTRNADIEYFKALISGVIRHMPQIDAKLAPRLDRGIQSLNPVELAILRIAVFELIHHLDVPYRAVVNEAIEIAKQYGASDAYKFVNGVLDGLATELRAVEASQKR